MRIIRRKNPSDHAEIEQKLTAQEKKLADHARRLRAIEIQLEIFKPSPLEDRGQK